MNRLIISLVVAAGLLGAVALASSLAIAGPSLDASGCDSGHGTGYGDGYASTSVHSCIVIEKQIIPAGAVGDFTFTGIPGGNLENGTISGAGQIIDAVEPGIYTVTEEPTPGFDLTSIVCADPTKDSGGEVGSSTATINLAVGETVTCIFTNTQQEAEQGQIIIVKQSDGAGYFDFTTNISHALTFSMPDGGQRGFEVDPGEYTVTEIPLPGFDLASIECEDPTDNSSGDVGNLTANINVVDGEAVTCTFTNTEQEAEQGQIVIKKETIPDVATGDFFFIGVATGTISDNGQIIVAVAPGEYTATEVYSLPLGEFDLTSIVCDDPTNNSSGDLDTRTATFRVHSGETVTCTFTNTKRGAQGEIIVKKETIPDGELGSFAFSGDASGTIADNGQIIVAVAPGEYTATEVYSLPLGEFDLTSIVCDDPTNNSSGDLDTRTATFMVGSGETVTCTFTNTKQQAVDTIAGLDVLEGKADTAATGDTDRDTAIAVLEGKADTAATGDTARDTAIAVLEGKADILEAKIDQMKVGLRARHDRTEQTLSTVIEMKRVHLQVIQLPKRRVPKDEPQFRRFLITSSEAGLPVDVSLVVVQVSDENEIGWRTVVPTQITRVKTGMWFVEVTADKLYEFRVSHTHGTDPTHWGVSVVHERGDRNLGAGQ